MKICVIKRSDQVFFRSVANAKLPHGAIKIPYSEKFDYIVEQLLNVLTFFTKVEIYNLMPQYGYYPSRASKVSTIFWDAAHLYENSLSARKLARYNLGLRRSSTIMYFFPENLKELEKVDKNFLKVARQIDFSANFEMNKRRDYTYRDVDILYVASGQERKNIPQFSAIVEHIAQIKPDLKAVLVGDHDKHNTKNLQVKKDLTNRELIELYRRSKIFLNTSNYEGIGLPNIEAKLQGCEIICNDIDIFRQVLGADAVYCDTFDTEAVLNASLQILGNAVDKKVRKTTNKVDLYLRFHSFLREFLS